MLRPVSSVEKRNISISDLAQLFAIAAPILYLLGRQYDLGYYRAIDCDWAIQLITFQETILHSVTPITAVLCGLITGLFLLHTKTEFKTILKYFVFSLISMLALYIIAKFTTTNSHLSNSMLTLGMLLTLYGVGLYIADTFFAFRFDNEAYQNFSITYLLFSLITAFTFTYSLGALSAEGDIASKENRLAELIESNIQYKRNKTYLVSFVGNRFLTVQYHGKEKGDFRLEDDLSRYSIKPLSKNPEITPAFAD